MVMLPVVAARVFDEGLESRAMRVPCRDAKWRCVGRTKIGPTLPTGVEVAVGVAVAVAVLVAVAVAVAVGVAVRVALAVGVAV